MNGYSVCDKMSSLICVNLTWYQKLCFFVNKQDVAVIQPPFRSLCGQAYGGGGHAKRRRALLQGAYLARYRKEEGGQ